jgi:hypothetical protein
MRSVVVLAVVVVAVVGVSFMLSSSAARNKYVCLGGRYEAGSALR